MNKFVRALSFMAPLLLLAASSFGGGPSVAGQGAANTNPAGSEIHVVPNPSMEELDPATAMPVAWQGGSWGDNEATFTHADDDSHSGQRSLRIDVTNFRDGDAKWFYPPQPADPTQVLAYTGWYKSNATTTLMVQNTFADGSNIYQRLATLPPSDDWTMATGYAMPLDSAVSVSIMHIIASDGWLVIDDVSVAQHAPVPLPDGGMVSLTFDDGFASSHDVVMPLLEAHDMVATHYVTTSFLGQDPYMSWEEVGALAEEDHEIGSHTATHASLISLDEPGLNQEVQDAHETIAENLGEPPASIASPYGHYDAKVLDVLDQTYQSHRSVEQGFNSPDTFDPNRILVQNIKSWTTIDQLRTWVDYAEQNQVWLVLVFHDIGQLESSEDSFPVDRFEAFVSYLAESNVTVCTVSEGVEIMSRHTASNSGARQR